MQLALNGATIMRSPLEDDVAIAAEAGFGALEVWAGKLAPYLETNSLDELAADLRVRQLRPWCINSIEDITFRDADGRRALLDELQGLAETARAIGAPSIVVVPGRLPEGRTLADGAQAAIDILRDMSEAAGDVALAFEFLGKPACAVPRLDVAVEIVESVDRTNVGMVIDTFHFHAGGSALEDIARVPVERLFVVHLNGCEDLPRCDLMDAHRLYPGEGVIPIDAILSSLRAQGYDGVFSVEIFRPEYWGQDPREVAREAFGTATAVLERAGFGFDG